MHGLKRVQILVVIAVGDEHAANQSRINSVDVILQVKRETAVRGEVGVLAADHEHNLGQPFAVHLFGVGIPGRCVPVDVENGIGLFGQQLQRCIAGASVGAPVVRQVEVLLVDTTTPCCSSSVSRNTSPTAWISPWPSTFAFPRSGT